MNLIQDHLLVLVAFLATLAAYVALSIVSPSSHPKLEDVVVGLGTALIALARPTRQ